MSRDVVDLTGERDVEDASPVEVRPIEVVRGIENPRLVTLKVQYETMAAMAMGVLRDPRAIVAASNMMLEEFPDLVERGTYAIPYKEHTDECKKLPYKQRATCTCPVTWIVGPSIHLATMLANEWGCCLDGALIYTSEHDGGSDLVEGFFLDFVRRRMIVRQRMVPRSRVTKSGQKYLIGQDAYWKEVEIHASKMHRNCILKGLPPYVVQPVYRHALELKNAAVHKEGLAVTWGKVLAYFERYHVDEEKILALLQRTGIEDVTAEDIGKLRSLVEADRAGFIPNVAGLFGVEEAPPDATPAAKRETRSTEREE